MTRSEQLKQVLFNDLANNMPSLERKASNAIKSFAELVDELNKVNKLSSGTTVNGEIKKVASDASNSAVYLNKSILDSIEQINQIVRSGTLEEEAEA